MTASPSDLRTLTRKPDRAGDRVTLDDVLDTEIVGTLSTVVDGFPWSVPMLFARSGNDILLHGSSGAGALRHILAGAPVAFTVFALDGIVVAGTLFDHSANYRSAVVRGTATAVDDPARALNILSDKLIPGRVAETRATTRKEIAATSILRLPIVDGEWLAKARTGGPSIESSEWTGVVPSRRIFDDPVTYTGDTPPASVRRLADGAQ